MFCKKCGNKIKEGISYCPFCGSRITQEPSTTAPSFSKKAHKKHRKTKYWPFIVIISIIMFILCAIIALLLGKKGGGNHNKNLLFSSNLDSNTLKYENGDFVYLPTVDSIEIDETNEMVYYNDLITVYLKENVSFKERKKIADSVNGYVASNLSGCINTMEIKIDPTDINKKIEELTKLEKVQFATYTIPLSLELNSTSLWDGEQNIGDEENPDGVDWWAEAIRAYTAWDYKDYTQDIVVGIMDNGFDTEHKDFLKDGESVIDVINNNSINHDYDSSEHGTHVAGLIAAQDNNIGSTGVSYNADVVCVDWLQADGTNLLTPAHVAENLKILIEYAAKKNTPIVINNSWGCNLGSLDWLFSIQRFKHKQLTNGQKYALASSACAMEIVDQLLQSGKQDFIIVQSAGNGYENGLAGYDTKFAGWFSGINDKTRDFCSTMFPFETIKSHLIIVGAVENKKETGKYKLTSFSNYGKTIDITAPGQNIYSTVLDDEFGFETGTSMAAPIVTGAAAYIWSLDRSLSASQVKQVLIETAEKSVGVRPDDKGREYPMLNVGAAATSVVMGVANCKVIDKNTGNGLKGVNCKRTNNISDSPAFSMDLTTSDNGELYASAIGNTTFVFEKEGYKTIEKSFNIGKKEELDLGIISMEPEGDKAKFLPESTQKYWIIFNEGYRNNRLEMSSCNSDDREQDLKIIWDKSLELSGGTSSGPYNQYYYNDNKEFEMIGQYDRFSDYASSVLASNLDVYDSNGNLLIKKSEWKEVSNIIDTDDYSVAEVKSFKNSSYTIFNISEISTWDEAKTFCEQKGGHLAVISSPEENSFLYNMMRDEGYESAYFGYTDKENEGDWNWVNGEKSSYENWHFEEPNNEYLSEHFGMFYWKFPDGTWNDGDFGYQTEGSGRAFICEWE